MEKSVAQTRQILYIGRMRIVYTTMGIDREKMVNQLSPVILHKRALIH